MRRKLINTHSLIYIFLIAIFTLTSYVSDQGVIRQEDNLRKSDIKIDNLTTSIYTVDSISNQLLSLSDFVTENLIELNRNQNFWIKNLILLDKNSKYADENMINNSIDYDYVIEQVKNRFMYHYRQILTNTIEVVDRFEYIHRWNPKYYENYFNEEGYYDAEILNWNFQVLFEKNIDSFYLKDFDYYYLPTTEKAIEEFSINNFFDIYTFSHFLLRNLESFYSIITKDSEKFDRLSLEYSNSLDVELSENKKISSLKNFLVLASIISQILSLFFLLLFFRNILITKT